MEKQRADDRKWLLDNARRLDQMEAQVLEQTLEAKENARGKCNDIDVRLRAELDKKIPKLVAESLGHTRESLALGRHRPKPNCSLTWPRTRQSWPASLIPAAR